MEEKQAQCPYCWEMQYFEIDPSVENHDFLLKDQSQNTAFPNSKDIVLAFLPYDKYSTKKGCPIDSPCE